MLSISKILVPVDFSERCLELMHYVRPIAERYSAEVVLMHIVDLFYTIPATGLSGPVLIPVSREEVARREKRMEQFAASELRGLRVKRVVYEGDAVSQVVSFAQTEGVGLIAMPTRGYGALRRFLLGSVTSKVLHDAACPVLTGVHLQDLSGSQPVRFATILCAVDLGPQSQEVLKWAKQAAENFGARLHIVHVVTALNPQLPIDPAPGFQLELETLVRNDLEKLQMAAGAESATVQVAGGEPAEAVCSYAASIDADLLIIGRGPRDPVAGRLPSNAYAIIRQSHRPVISI